MHRLKATSARRAIAWLLVAATYTTVLVIAGNLAAAPASNAATPVAQTGVAANGAAEGALDLASDGAAAVARHASESPLATVGVAAALLALAGTAWLVAAGRRRMADRRAARRPASAGRPTRSRRSTPRVTITT